jgi:nucleotide-binding universal stress UspA family protein
MTVIPTPKRLLVPIDFSRCSAVAFRYAKFMGRTFSSTIHLIHVVDERYVEKTAEIYGKDRKHVEQELCRRARDTYKVFLADNDHEKIVAEEIVTVGTPFQVIALKAQALPADMIIMGGHGRVGDGQLDKIFFGSNAEKVVRLLPCPVLCVPEGVAGSG